MTKLNFKENAEAIFDISVSETPFPFRNNTRKGLTKLLLDNYGEDGEITEARIIKMIKENTPKPFLGMGMKAIRPLITDPALKDS